MNDLKIPTYITQNLKYKLRPYQEEAIQNFLQKQDQHHLLFEMATGTGKTLIMAALILYFKEYGYDNFIFFVNSTNILEKTKQNFANQNTNKYLFSDTIEIKEQLFDIKVIESLEDSNPDCINILFTTIQGLHIQIKNPKENSFTLEDFKEHKIILLSDEAHHNNTNTKTEKELFTSWEDSILNIFQQNQQNYLLEFTATAELDKPSIREKYKDKIVLQYDLKSFRKDGYSKNIFVAQVKTDNQKERFFLSILISQYRLEIASKYGINLKPVLLFKSKTIKESNENHQFFNEIIEKITEKDIGNLFFVLSKYRSISIFNQVYEFFKINDFSYRFIKDRIKVCFSKDKIINANSDSDIKKLQIQLNTLEDKDNRFRVVFAVDKLNEGWDVLNLFDIVKLYETPSVINKPPTAKEIQLIGRGARLYPFSLNDETDRYKRKFDADLSNEMIILEQLHFHTSDGSKYIEQLNQDLEKAGLINHDKKEVEIKLKDDFKQSSFFKHGNIYLNRRIEKKDSNIQTDLFGNIDLDKKFESIKGVYHIEINLDNIQLDDNQSKERFSEFNYEKEYKIPLKKVPDTIFLKAIAKNKNFHFNQIRKRLVLKTILDLKKQFKNNFLTIKYPKEFQEKEVKTPKNLLKVCSDFLQNLHSFTNEFYSEYIGTERLESKKISDIFKDKKIIINKNDTLFDGKKHRYLAQEKIKINTYEKEVVELLWSFLEQKNLEQSWLIRNVRHFQIYNIKDGKAFEPDFLLITKNKLFYQIFIEPKNEKLSIAEKWKADLMGNLEEYSMKEKNYRIIALPFYNLENKDHFERELNRKIELIEKTK